MKKLSLTLISVILTIALIMACVPLALAESNPSLDIYVMSDIHYLPADYIGDVNGFNYRADVDNDRKLEQYADEIIDATISNIIAAEPDCVLIPGDLVMTGQYDAHVKIIEKLRRLEDSGIETYVVPGNHDVSKDGTAKKYVVNDPTATVTVAGVTYVSDAVELARGTTYSEFETLYADFGYGKGEDILARATDSLSYVAQLCEGYRLIAVDASCYENGYIIKDKNLDGGRLDWVTQQINACTAAGDIPLVMMHYNILEKYPGQSVVMSNNYLPDRDIIFETLADARVNYLFTGHSHANDITKATTADGNTLYEICTGSLLLHGSPYRSVKFSGKDAKIKTEFLPSTESIEDFQGFCQDYYYTDGVRIMMRNRAIIGAAVAAEKAIDSDIITKETAFDFVAALMQKVIDRLLDTELYEGITVCDVLTQAYKIHYAGDESYSEEMQNAVKQIRNGSAFIKAFEIVFESLGEQLGISSVLAAVLPGYRDILHNLITDSANAFFSGILGSMGGEFLDGIFTDISPADNDLEIVIGAEEVGIRTPAVRIKEIITAVFRMIAEAVM